MDSATKRDIRRSLIAQATMDIFRIYASRYYDANGSASFAPDSIIGSAIAVGHAEGRHMTAGDIAVTIGIPRSTVIARLKLLEAAGVIEYRMVGRRKVIWISSADDDVLDKMEEVVHRVARALIELSDRDTSSRDTEDGTD